MNDDDLVAVRAVVSGRVQGVFYRATTAKMAKRLGLVGHVYNHPAGNVHVLAQGAAGDVRALLAWLRQGPAGARVDDVLVEDALIDDELGGFEIRHAEPGPPRG